MNTFWDDSIELMLLGMGSVFVFLSLLVVGVIVMSTVINKLSKPELSPSNAPTTPDAEIAAVAASAWVKAQTK